MVELGDAQTADLLEAAVHGAIRDDGAVPLVPTLEDVWGLAKEADEVTGLRGEAAIAEFVVAEEGETGRSVVRLRIRYRVRHWVRHAGLASGCAVMDFVFGV